MDAVRLSMVCNYAERDAQRPPPTATPAIATDCKITQERENGKCGGGSVERQLAALLFADSLFMFLRQFV